MPLAFSHWGTVEAEVVDGRLVAVHPLDQDPDPSPIAQNLLDVVDHPLRVRRPAIRRGFLDELEAPAGERGAHRVRRRGADAFVQVSWDEALDVVASELDRVRREHGNSAIFGGSYGWGSAGRFHLPQNQLWRFLNLLGGFTWSNNSYSYAAAEVILPYVVGPWFEILGAHTSFDQLAQHGRLVVALGGLPAKNQQVENGGTYRHLAPSGLRALREAGVRVLSVSPLRGDVDDDLGAEWLPIRPGTDTALLLGVAAVLEEEGLVDEGFLGRYCHGVERFRATLSRQGCSSAWASAICGIPAERIRALARDMAAGPTMLTAAWALQRADHGEQAYWATVAVAALLGQVGTPGGGFGLGYGSVNRIGSSEAAFSLPRLPIGPNPVTSFIPVARITELLEGAAAGSGADGIRGTSDTMRYDGGELTLPDIRAVYWCGGNPFHHHQHLARLSRAWQRPEVVVVHEQVWNPLARRADVVLPATTTLERDDFGSAPLTGAIVAMPALVAPPGEARDDYVTFSALADRLGVGEAFTEGLDTSGWLRRLWSDAIRRARAQGFDLPSFDELWAKGVVALPPPSPGRPRVLLAAFRADPVGAALHTPSGRIELGSDVLDAFDLPDCGATPEWIEPAEWLGSPLAARFPLHLLSHQPAGRLHSQLDFGRTSQQGKVAGREALRISPTDARARGIASGDVVIVANDRGRCLAGALIDEGIMPGVVCLATGAWFDPLDPLDPSSLELSGNPNVLTDDRPASQLSQAPAAQSCLVEVTRWPDGPGDPPPPASRAHELPEFVPAPSASTLRRHGHP